MLGISRKPVTWVGVTVAIAAAVVLLVADRAEAVDCSDFPYAGEAGMIASDCRENTIDPGVDQVLGHTDLLEPRAKALLNDNGFDDQWLHYAPIVTQTFNQSSGTQWSFCDTYNPDEGRFSFTSAGFVCDGAAPLGFTEVTGSFDSNSVALRVFSYGGGFISIACGNFSQDEPTRNPTPKIKVFKFHDYNRNGVQDAGEPPMAGVAFEAGRQSSLVGEGSTVLGTFTTNGAGEIVIPLVGEGPGRYYFEEVVPAGFFSTTPPLRHTVLVPFGAGDRTFPVAPFGNSETETDVSKTFELTDAPAEMEVGVTAQFTLRSTLTNHGPAGPVDVRETLTVTGPPDCVIDPPAIVREVTLGRPGVGGQPPSQRVFDDVIDITCSQPSFHGFTFTNEVEVISARVDDPDLSNNTVSFEETREVFADADLTIVGFSLDCTPDPLVGEDFTCIARGEVANLGPFEPVDGNVRLELSGPADCVTTANTEIAVTGVTLASPESFAASWTASCTDRSFHPFTAEATVEPGIHIRDGVDNNTASDEFVVEVVEVANLVASDASIVCTELWDGDPFTCTLEVTVGNEGPGDDVRAVVSGELAGSPNCVVSPDRVQSTPTTLAAGAEATFTFVYRVDCGGEPALHTFTAFGRIVQDEPHVIDEPADNETKIVWVPIDFKPNSDPNTFNPGRGGVGTVAILGTADFDPFAEVDVATLRFGPTGTEAEVVGCATEPEDVNGDGFGDMTCRFRNQDMGFVAGDELAILTGLLNDGCEFMGADRVRVLD